MRWLRCLWLWEVAKIKDNALFGCVSLKAVTLSKALVFVGENAFYGCDELDRVDYHGTLEDKQKITVETGNTPFTTVFLGGAK